MDSNTVVEQIACPRLGKNGFVTRMGGDTWDGGSSPFSPPFTTILKAILHKCILAFSVNKNEGEREIFQIQVKR